MILHNFVTVSIIVKSNYFFGEFHHWQPETSFEVTDLKPAGDGFNFDEPYDSSVGSS